MNLPAGVSKRLVLLAFSAGLLVGCAALPQPGPAGGFVLRGKLGVVDARDSFSARFLWQQQGDAFDIELWGPLGQGRVRLTGRDGSMALVEGDGTVIDSGTPDAVMRRHLGFSLPMAVLPAWVRGAPAAGHRVSGRVVDGDGRLTAFRQLGWTVALERFGAVEGGDVPVSAGAGPAATPASTPTATPATLLPHRITASRGDYRVRLAVSDWQF